MPSLLQKLLLGLWHHGWHAGWSGWVKRLPSLVHKVLLLLLPSGAVAKSLPSLLQRLLLLLPGA